jgi:hypothetical protein
MRTEKALLVSVLGLVLFFEILNTIQNNNKMNSTKHEIQELAENSIENVLNGEASALEKFIENKKLEEYHKRVSEAVKPEAIIERELYNEKRLNKHGAFIELSNTGDRLDYSHCPKWCEARDILKEIEHDLKMSAKTKHEVVDCNGEIVPKVPVKTHGKQIIKVSY